MKALLLFPIIFLFLYVLLCWLIRFFYGKEYFEEKNDEILAFSGLFSFAIACAILYFII